MNMKKISFICLAILLAATVNAQVMHVWSNNQSVHQQTVESVDSITFENDSANIVNIPTVGNICKTWKKRYLQDPYDNYYVTYSLTFNSDGTFTYSFTAPDVTVSTSGKYLIQGNLILLCNTSSPRDGMPTCVVYNNGKIYGSFGYQTLAIELQ
jgi:hypothetical protein